MKYVALDDVLRVIREEREREEQCGEDNAFATISIIEKKIGELPTEADDDDRA
jgi:hypothetical protein